MSPISATTPAPDTSLAGAALKRVQQAAIAFIGTDQRIYQMNYDGFNPHFYPVFDVMSVWQTQGGVTLPFPRPGSGTRRDGTLFLFAVDGPDGGTTYLSTGIYLCYIDVSNHVIAVPGDDPFRGEFYPVDLTDDTGAPPARADSFVSGWTWTQDQSMHVVYVGDDDNIWELYWTPGSSDPTRPGLKWLSNNLSTATGYTGVLGPKQGGPLASAMFQANGTEHVVYIAEDNTLRELKSSVEHGWVGSDLSQATGAVAPAANSPIAAFACDYETTLHVCYLGVDGAIHELWWDESGWHPGHTISDAAPAPAADTDIAGYASEYEKVHHVVYTDANRNLIELYRKDGSWDVTALMDDAHPRPPLNTAAPLVGYATEFNQGEHVVYLTEEPRIQELYRENDQWKADTPLAGSASVLAASETALLGEIRTITSNSLS